MEERPAIVLLAGLGKDVQQLISERVGLFGSRW